MIKLLKKILSFHPVLERLLVLSFMDLKLKYQNGVLGFFWSFLKPLIQFVAYYVVFGLTLKLGKTEYYPLQLFLGILTWAWFSEATNLGISSFINKKPIITQIATNKLYPPLSAFLTPTMSYLLNFTIFFVAYLFFVQTRLFDQTGYSFFEGLFVFFQSLFTIAFIIVSLSILLAYINAKYRDMQAIWELVVMYGIFLTPIFYTLPIPPEYQALYFTFNPLALPFLLLKSVFFPVSLPHLSVMAHFSHWLLIAAIFFGSQYLHAKFKQTIADFI